MPGLNNVSDKITTSELSEILAEFLATNPYKCVTFGRTVDLVNNPENIPAYGEWLAKVVVDACAWADGREESS